MNTPWHVDEDLALKYADGDLGATMSASVEAHLMACAGCRQLLGPAVPEARLDRIWGEIAEAVDAPVPGTFERLLRVVGVRAHTARLIGAAYSLRMPWIVAVALALLFAAFASGETSRWGTLAYLAVAPVLPVTGVALAYGPRTDPSHEIGLAAPYSAFTLMLMRAAAVLASTSLIAVAVGATMLGRGWIMAAWLLPALMLTALTLVLSSWIDPVYGGVAVCAIWLTAAVLSAVHDDPGAMFGAAGQVTSAIVAALSVLTLVLRRDRFNEEQA